MKKILLLFLTLTCFILSNSQSLEDGKKYIYYHRYESAENVLHIHISSHPTDAEAWMLLTKSYLFQNKLQRAKDSLSFASPTLTDVPYFLIAKGALCLMDKKTDSSRWYFDQAIDLTKGKDVGILEAVADMQIISGNSDMSFALDVLKKAVKRDKNNAWLHLLEGNAYRNLHNGGEAFKAYTIAINENNSLAEAYYLLGDIFLSQKNAELYVDYFNRAIAADKNYGPAYYELYNYYLYTKPDAAKAMDYFQQYAKLSDKTTGHDYSYTDLLYLNKNYTEAVANAKMLIAKEGDKVQPRLYKLIAYSYAESKDTANAISYMGRYFQFEHDSNFIAKDFETMAQLFQSSGNNIDSSIAAYYQKASAISRDSASLYQYYKELAGLAAAKKDYLEQVKWLGKYVTGNEKAGNVDLFNWGIAAYRSENYLLADSVFGLYTEKYPLQGFGYYWRARTNAALDSGMAEGLAVPHYNKLIEVVNKDSLSATDRKWMVEAFGYVAAYEANIQKDYEKAIELFDKILEIDPENANAKKFIPILESNAKKKEETN